MATGKETSAAMAAILRAAKESRGLSNEALASAAGLGTTSVGRYLNGEREMTVPVIAELSRALGTTPAEVLRQATRLEDRPLTPSEVRDLLSVVDAANVDELILMLQRYLDQPPTS